MTFVLSMITNEWVVQVSDRRLVWFDQGKIVRQDDERNKAVVWCSRLVFGYTGEQNERRRRVAEVLDPERYTVRLDCRHHASAVAMTPLGAWNDWTVGYIVNLQDSVVDRWRGERCRHAMGRRFSCVPDRTTRPARRRSDARSF